MRVNSGRVNSGRWEAWALKKEVIPSSGIYTARSAEDALYGETILRFRQCSNRSRSPLGRVLVVSILSLCIVVLPRAVFKGTDIIYEALSDTLVKK